MKAIHKQVPKIRIKRNWASIEKVVLELASARNQSVVEVFVDSQTLDDLTKDYIGTKCKGVEIKFCQREMESPFGFRFNAFTVMDEFGRRVEARLVTDQFLDDSNKVRKKRGFKPYAFALDFSKVNIATGKVSDKKSHRVIHFNR